MRFVSGLVLALALLGGCRRPRQQVVGAMAELPYPSCEDGGGAQRVDGGEAVVVARGRLRGTPESMAEGAPLETFELVRRGCLYVHRGRQEWAQGIADTEVVFDEGRRPLRAWMRLTSPASTRADGDADFRRYELRTAEVSMKHRFADGRVVWSVVKGKRPTAVIGPGRGMLTAWIQRARLAPGEKVREPVLDIREPVEVIRDVTLRREADRFEPRIGRDVRVYTIYGREAVFTDEDDVVVGDLAGLRPSALVGTPEPAPMPTFAPLDPVGTP